MYNYLTFFTSLDLFLYNSNNIVVNRISILCFDMREMLDG